MRRLEAAFERDEGQKRSWMDNVTVSQEMQVCVCGDSLMVRGGRTSSAA